MEQQPVEHCVSRKNRARGRNDNGQGESPHFQSKLRDPARATNKGPELGYAATTGRFARDQHPPLRHAPKEHEQHASIHS